jgi:hypothetical protein
MSSGYTLRNGYDISTIFAPGSSPGVVSGYALQNGEDISTIFAPGSSPGVVSGYALQNGEDISTIFAPLTMLTLLDISGCCLWMDASDLNSITVLSGKVSIWNDKSPNNYIMGQPTTSNQPTFTSNSLNGLSTLTFNSASSNYLYGDSRTNQFGVGYNSYSLFSVSRGAGYIYAKSLYGSQNGRILMSNTFISFAHTSDRGIPSITDPDSATTYHILELIVNRSGLIDYVFRNGTEVARISTSDPLYNFTNTNTMLIGAYNNGTGGIPPQGGYYLQGNVAEIVSYANTYDMTSETRQRIEGVLAWKWGLQSKLPVGHPHRITPPSA